MGLLILACCLLAFGFFSALALAAFIAWHFWRDHRESQKAQARLLEQITKRPPYDEVLNHQTPQRVVRAYDDQSEASLEQLRLEQQLQQYR